jgi:hypothetical protein
MWSYLIPPNAEPAMANDEKSPSSPAPYPGQDLTPIYTSYMFARIDKDLARLTFGDAVPGVYDPRFHTALVIQTENAVQFAKLILELFEKSKEASVPPPRQGG